MHKIIVAKVDRVAPIDGADNIQIGFVLGEQIVISKTTNVGDVGLFFPVDLQLSEQFCHENNLFRDSSKNKNVEKKGFFEGSRRVRSQPFLKVKSNGIFMPFESVGYAGDVPTEIGTQFDTLGGNVICQKYISEKARQKLANQKIKAVKLDLFPTFKKHVDSEQFKYNTHLLKKGDLLSFHAKVHGTSFRVGYLTKNIVLPWWKRWFNKLGAGIPTTTFDFVVGTRNVVISSEEKEGFHGSEAFRFEVFNQIKPFLQPGMSVYGEIAGYANGKPIMPTGDVKSLKDKRYTDKYGKENVFSYGCKEHEFRFHIYRITNETLSGKIIDMPQKELESWCENRGFIPTLEVHPQMIYDGNEEALRQLVEDLTERPDLLTEDYINPGQIGEGVIIRIDNERESPKFLKNKSFAFKVLEGLQEADDIETTS